MLRRLLHTLAAFLLVFSLSLPFASAQGDVSIDRGVKLDPAQEQKSSESSPALAYFILALYTMLVLTIVCMPSRKA